LVLLETIRLFVCENHPIVIDGVVSVFRNHSRVELVGSCAWDARTIENIKRSAADVFLFDYTQLKRSGLPADSVRQALRSARLVAFAESVDLVETMQALDDGAAGIVLKSSTLEEIEAAVLRVAAGDNYLDDKIFRNLTLFAAHSLGDHHLRN
jgi:DNA-binding NarL/FixJ family response regulator